MTQQALHSTYPPDLQALALAFVVQVQGTWTQEAVTTFQSHLLRQGWRLTQAELERVLERAQQHFMEGSAHLFLCTGRACLQRCHFDVSLQAWRRTEAVCHLSMTQTACQGPCKQAPVATLRVGRGCAMFAQFMRADQWQAVTDFARRAAEAGTLLIDPGTAQPFYFDPVHDSHGAPGALQAMQFLLGHFNGDGTLADGTHYFHKEIVGTWEVGGRFLGLRMSVTYPLPDGRKDTHTAMAMIGVHPEAGHLEARVYTDGGARHDFQLEVDGDSVRFNERVQGHSRIPATRARKILRPTASGVEERLELDRGNGRFEPYYIAPMYRTA